jgi:hypothetical protein
MNESPSQKSTRDQLKIPALAAAGGLALLLGKTLFRHKKHVRTKSHFHAAVEHEHEHVHVTHNRIDPEKGVGGWEHLTATHSHKHNHAAMEHDHRPHRHPDAEHRSEAHVHDHDHPIGEGH